jgi:HSP20 family protein
MTTAMVQQNENGQVRPHSWASATVDVLEGADAFLVYAEVPGVKKEDVGIEFQQGELRFHAKRTIGEPSEYRRTFAVGQEVDVERISAHLENGVLRVELPKKAAAKARSIAIA